MENMLPKFFPIYIALILLAGCSASSKDQSNSTSLEDKGYTQLFNEKNLDGWDIPEGDGGHWKVVDGVIDYDALSEAEGDKSLYTTKNDFKDYKLHVEWRFTSTVPYEGMPVVLPNGEYARKEDGEMFTWERENADSGIIMRGASQVQIWNWDIGSGEIWSTRTNEDLSTKERAKATPNRRADNLPGEWNTFDITLKDDRVTVVLNDVRVIEEGWMPDLPEQGPIGLQHHGGKRDDGTIEPTSSTIQFRNIWVKEL